MNRPTEISRAKQVIGLIQGKFKYTERKWLSAMLSFYSPCWTQNTVKSHMTNVCRVVCLSCCHCVVICNAVLNVTIDGSRLSVYVDNLSVDGGCSSLIDLNLAVHLFIPDHSLSENCSSMTSDGGIKSTIRSKTISSLEAF